MKKKDYRIIEVILKLPAIIYFSGEDRASHFAAVFSGRNSVEGPEAARELKRIAPACFFRDFPERKIGCREQKLDLMQALSHHVITRGKSGFTQKDRIKLLTGKSGLFRQFRNSDFFPPMLLNIFQYGRESCSNQTVRGGLFFR